MTQYTHTTFITGKLRLAERLGDASKVHWVDSELGLYIKDAIRVFNAVAGLHRDRDIFSTAQGTVLYDLPTKLTVSAGRAYTLRDVDAIGFMQYMLMEPYSPSSFTTLSEMWSGTEIIQALQRARDEFLDASGCVLTERPIIVPGGGSDIVSLPDTVMSVRRAVWKDQLGNYTQMWPSDERMFVTANLTPGTPTSYSIVSLPELSLRLSPTPLDSGTLYLLTVESGAALDPTANANAGTVLGIPDDLVWGVRSKAMAILLRKEGPARDPARAEACEELFDMAVEIAHALPVVLAAEIDGRQVIPTTLARVDANRAGWQGKNQDTPETVAVAGPATVVVCPVPDGSEHSIALEFVRNAIVPSGDNDYLQIPREALDDILAWAEMLACFKSQGDSFENARTASKKLLERAAYYNSKRVAQSQLLTDMLQQSTDEYIDRPLYRESDSGNTDNSPAQSERKDSASSRQSRNRAILHRRQKKLGGR